MSLPAPRPGLIIRYGFLWSHERRSGAEEAAKDRPCVIIAATRNQFDSAIKVTVVPVTHTPPDDPSASIALDRDTAARLGLDDQPQWLRLDELNRFTWPGYDLRPLPNDPTRFAYGMLPLPLFTAMRTAILARQKPGQPIQLSNRD